jgi:hypothetical protein
MKTMSQKQNPTPKKQVSFSPVVQVATKQQKKKKKNGNSQSVDNRFPSGIQRYNNRSSRNVAEFDEYVADVNGSVTFATTAYPFNPGQSVTFPRFYREAVLFEKWICISATPYFKPQVSAFATNGQVGKVMLSHDYDSSDSPPNTKQQVEDSDPHSDGMPYEVIKLVLDPRQLNDVLKGKYVRPGGLPGSASINDFDGGVTYVSTIGCSNTTNIGEFRIKSSWVLIKPVLEDLTVPPTAFRTTAFYSASPESLTSTVQTTLALATTTVNGIQATNTSGSILLPVGNYVITASVQFNDSATSTTNLDMVLKKDSVDYAFNYHLDLATGSIANTSMSASWFLTSNGSNSIALSVTSTGGGTLTAEGYLVIQTV